MHNDDEVVKRKSTWDHTLPVYIVQFQKISILRPQKGLEFPRGLEGSVRQKNLKKSMKLHWNFQRDGGGLGKIPSMGELWNYTFKQ